MPVYCVVCMRIIVEALVDVSKFSAPAYDLSCFLVHYSNSSFDIFLILHELCKSLLLFEPSSEHSFLFLHINPQY